MQEYTHATPPLPHPLFLSLLVLSTLAAQSQGISQEADEALQADLAITPFELPEGFARREMLSERADLAPLVSGQSFDGSGDGSGDFDADGLTDAEEALLGTLSDNPDTDGDTLLDGWEVHTINGLDLRAIGASPLRKDIFVEMDYMIRPTGPVDFRPTAEEKTRIVTAFDKANVTNPDGSTGISIHLVDGNEVPHDPALNPVQLEFFALKAAHFDPVRAPVFHYMIWADAYNTTTSSGISMNIPHSDFIVTLGLWNTPGGTPDQKVGTFIHELGHNLGLTHGGSDHVGFKPNHLSVMNYSFQTGGVPFFDQRLFTYQRFALSSLNERALVENDGLGRSPALFGVSTVFNLPSDQFITVPAHAAIDWDNDNVIDEDPVAGDINNDFLRNTLAATPHEWAQLIFNGGSIGSPLSTAGAMDYAEDSMEELPFDELTQEMADDIANVQ